MTKLRANKFIAALTTGLTATLVAAEMVAVVAVMAVAPVVQADDLTPSEIKTLTDYFKQYVHVVTKPFYVYHWAPTASQYAGHTQASDPSGLQYAQKASGFFWKDLPKKDNDNLFGVSLYTAPNPVSSYPYGKADPTLIQIQVESGFKMLDFLTDDRPFGENTSSNPVIQSLLQKAGCNGKSLSTLFNNTCTSTPQKWCLKGETADSCVATLTAVFKNNLKIDGFSYLYPNGFKISGCDPTTASSMNNSAFVITNPAILTQKNVKTFTRFTDDDQEDRIRIQSQFYVAAQSFGVSELNMLMQRIQMNSYARVTSMDSDCGDVQCKVTFHLCSNYNSNDCSLTTTTVPRRVIHPGISIANQPVIEPANFFWKDLDGKDFTPDLDQWNRENLYGCTATPPYVSLKEYEAAQALTQSSCKAPSVDNSQEKFDNLGRLLKKACDEISK